MDLFLGGRDELTPEEKEARRQASERIRQSADPQIMARIERWIHHRMLPERPSLPMAIRPQPTRFDRLSDWNAGYLGVRGEVETPYELSRDLKEAVPQSILRDIYRPVRRESAIDPVYHDLELDPGGRRALAEARAGLTREAIPTIEPGLLVLIREQRRRRRFLLRPWRSFRPDEAPRFYSPQDHHNYIEEDDEGDEE